MKAIILSHITDEYLKRIEEFFTVIKRGACIKEQELTMLELDDLVSAVNPDVIVIDSTPLSQEIISKAPQLKLVVCTRGNPVNVDRGYLNAREIPLTCTPGRNANSVAEFTLALILSSFRHITQADSSIRAGVSSLDLSPEKLTDAQKDVIWYHPNLDIEPYDIFKGKELMGSTLGMIGYGAIGRLLAQKALMLGMRVLVYDPYVPQEAFSIDGVVPVTMKELQQQSDVISLHAKLTDETTHLIDDEFLSAVKNDVYIINTSRGGMIDTKALIRALDEKRIGGAALDVFEYEPLSLQDVLLKHDDVIVTPHIGGASIDVATHHSRMAWEAVQAFMDGNEIPYLV